MEKPSIVRVCLEARQIAWEPPRGIKQLVFSRAIYKGVSISICMLEGERKEKGGEIAREKNKEEFGLSAVEAKTKLAWEKGVIHIT